MVEPTAQHKNKLIINYGRYSVIVNKLIEKIKDLDFNYVYGLPRGGLSFAVILSHVFNKPLISDQAFNLISDTSKVLIVDDICDTGKTLGENKGLSNLPFITLVAKPVGKNKIDNLIYGELVSDDTWVVFPWEQFKVEDK
jgi:hypoxanthine phosphoribosyltransferase